MGTKKHSIEQIIAKLRKSEIMLDEGKSLEQVPKKQPKRGRPLRIMFGLMTSFTTELTMGALTEC